MDGALTNATFRFIQMTVGWSISIHIEVSPLTATNQENTTRTTGITIGSPRMNNEPHSIRSNISHTGQYAEEMEIMHKPT